MLNCHSYAPSSHINEQCTTLNLCRINIFNILKFCKYFSLHLYFSLCILYPSKLLCTFLLFILLDWNIPDILYFVTLMYETFFLLYIFCVYWYKEIYWLMYVNPESKNGIYCFRILYCKENITFRHFLVPLFLIWLIESLCMYIHKMNTCLFLLYFAAGDNQWLICFC